MKNIGNTICFATSYNRPKKHDGDEFTREMHLFKQCYQNEINWVFDYELEKGELRQQIISYLKCIGLDGENKSKLLFNNFIFFMHGTWRSLIGVHHNIWTTQKLVTDIFDYMDTSNTINIVLYACGCGGSKGKWKRIHEYKLGSRWDMRGEFGFAMRLANDLSEIGIHDYRIFAHIGSGHVTKRPFCVSITEENGIINRQIIVPYHSWASLNRKNRRQWLRWVKFIRETRNGRFHAPFLTETELAEIIGE